MLASVIIPSYNCAPWLVRATASAYALGVDDVQVIIVDDGSTDDTPAVCTELKSRYATLQVIRRVNGGLSAARNTGIEAATGTFVILLDADDELIPFDLKSLETFTGDMLRVGVEEVPVQGASILRQETSGLINANEYLAQKLRNFSLYVPSWAYIYRRSFLLDNELRFADRLIHEDMLFTVEALLKAQSVAASSALLYRYFRRPGSITLQNDLAATQRRIDSLTRILNAVLELANRHRDIDVWPWAAHVADYAWTYASAARSRRLAWQVFRMEWTLFIRYRLWGVFRSKRSVRWRLRRGIERIVSI